MATESSPLDAVDTAALGHVADAITAITGTAGESAAAQAAQLAAASRRVMYAALNYTATGQPRDRDALLAAVRDEVGQLWTPPATSSPA
jgi:hypothetical protein